MPANDHSSRRQKRAKAALDSRRLEELALAYVARYATSAAKLTRYLRRKLHERGWTPDEPPPDIAGLVQRYAELGYIDDDAFARVKSDSLLRRGYGERRIGAALGADGIDEAIRERVLPDAPQARQALLAFARRRRLGPFAARPLDRPAREKQLAAMLRAGHSLDNARQMIDAADEQAARTWAHELDEDDSLT